MEREAKSVFLRFPWTEIRDYTLIVCGAFLQALAIRLFLVPVNLVNGGVSGASQLINYYTGWPIGLMILIGNIPLFLLGWRYLGGKRFALRTAAAVVSLSLFTDLLFNFLPAAGLTKDLFLNTLYGGVVSGVGYGLVYLGRGTSGGSDILARILNHKGIPISKSYLMTDALVMFGAGLSFSWENALYALVMLYISGVAAEATMGGSHVLRTVMIITNNPDPICKTILYTLERGATVLEGKGAYTGSERTVLYIVVSRSEVNQIKALVREVDPQAFVVIGAAQEALGEGFIPLGKTR